MIHFNAFHRLILVSLVVIFASVISPAEGASPSTAKHPAGMSDVVFVSNPQSQAMKQAIAAVSKSESENIAISDVSAALIDLNNDGIPELLVHLGGGYCGSDGCSVMLYERGTTGWIKTNAWLAGFVSISDNYDGAWRKVIINHEEVWRHAFNRYTTNGGLGQTGFPTR